ncbi:MAG TPA: pitrilysin family protein [Candidatus Saccharimonadales bacterium]|nr:pitrilysin family protein [Candidatus Saccharimonadales bacterium]
MKHTVSEITLKNKARGLLVHVPEASVMTFEVNFRAGEYLVKPEKWETPHLMEHMLLGANKQFPRARDFHAEFEKNGAYNNASTNVYEVSYEAECADFEWDRILELLTLSITEPLFLEEDLKAEFGNVREEMTYRSNNHFRQLSLALREQYGLLAKTDKERLRLMSNVNLNDIRQHYKRTHTTGNMRFVIAGNITPTRREAIEKAFAEISLPHSAKRLPLPDERPVRLAEPLYIRNRTVDNVYFYVDTFIGRRLSDPETDALALINTMLTETLYSKILGQAREKGLVYDMNSGWGQTKFASNWWFGTQVLPANAPKLFAIIIKELIKVFNGQLKPEDIAAAQAYSIGRFQRSAQTVGGAAAGYSGRYFFDDIIEDYDQVPKRIKAVTKQSMVDIARAMFAENIWGFGLLGNCGIDLVREWEDQLAPLWDHKMIKH